MAASTPRLVKPIFPVLSQLEFSEKLNHLSAGKRLLFAIITALTWVGMFGLAIVTGVALMSVVAQLLGTPIQTIEQVLWTGLQVLCVMLIAVGFSGSTIPQSVLPGTTLKQSVIESARQGVISGFFVSFGFGLIWGFVTRLHLILQVVIPISWGVLLGEIVLFGVILGVTCAPAFALYRAVITWVSLASLHWLDQG